MNDATVKMPIEPWGKSSKSTVLPMLESIVNMMEMAMATEQKVVVHCSMGMERSVLATVWYLVRNKGMDLDNAYSFVRSVRPIATDRREWIIS
jgi:dual specificity MAP kinase phosphatase